MIFCLRLAGLGFTRVDEQISFRAAACHGVLLLRRMLDVNRFFKVGVARNPGP